MTKLTENTYKFTPTYREAVNPSDATPVTLRLVIPADKPLLERGIDNFLPESRFHCFLSAKLKLTNADLRYLTKIDGVDQIATAFIWPHKEIRIPGFHRGSALSINKTATRRPSSYKPFSLSSAFSVIVS